MNWVRWKNGRRASKWHVVWVDDAHLVGCGREIGESAETSNSPLTREQVEQHNVCRQCWAEFFGAGDSIVRPAERWAANEIMGVAPNQRMLVMAEAARDVIALLEENEKLREFAGHKVSCPVSSVQPGVMGPPKHCNCGFSAFLMEQHRESR